MLSKEQIFAGVTLFILACLPLVGCVGASSELWSKTFGGDDMDACTSMLQTPDGGFALLGFAHSFGTDAWLVKTDTYGNIEWNQTYGTENQDTNPSLVKTSDGGFALAGYTWTDPLADFWLVKTNNHGNMLWNQTYSGGAVLGLPSLIQTVDGGFALSGGKGSFETGDYDFWLIKTDVQGIAEFPSLTPLLLPFIALTVALALYKWKLPKPKAAR